MYIQGGSCLKGKSGGGLKWLKRSGAGKGYWMNAKDKAQFKQATQHGVCVVTEKKDRCRPKKVAGQPEMCEEGKTDLLIYAYPHTIRASSLGVRTGLKDAKVGEYMTFSFRDYMKGSCGAVNTFPGMKGSHGSPGDCSNYYTRSEYVATLCSRGRPDKRYTIKTRNSSSAGCDAARRHLGTRFFLSTWSYGS